MNNVVIASGEHQKDPAIYMYSQDPNSNKTPTPAMPVSILPQITLLSRMLHCIEQSSTCYTLSPCRSSILNTAVYTCPSQTP